GKRDRSRDACAPEFCFGEWRMASSELGERQILFAIRTRHSPSFSRHNPRQTWPAGGPGFHHDHARHVQHKKEAERRKTLSIILRILRCGAAPTGAAHLPAFHSRSCQSDSRVPEAQLGLVYPERGAAKRRVTAAGAAPVYSDAPRLPVIVPALMMPEPPG